MATNHTTNYNLNLWEPTDKFSREEINENTQKLDAAVKAVDTKADGKADAAAVTALAQTVAQGANCRIVTGSYVGTGEYGYPHSNSLTFPGKPLFVAINNAKACFWGIQQATGTGMIPSSGSAFSMNLIWSGNTITWYSDNRADMQLNAQGITYYYIALIAT